MGYYRYKSRKEKERLKRRSPDEAGPSCSGRSTAGLTDQTWELTSHSAGRLEERPQLMPAFNHPETTRWHDPIGAPEQDDQAYDVNKVITSLRRNSNKQRHQSFPKSSTQVLDYENSYIQEQRHLRMIAAKVARIVPALGDGVDPFDCLPPFEHPELDALVLLRKCTSSRHHARWQIY